MTQRRSVLQTLALSTWVAWAQQAIAAGQAPMPPGLRRVRGEVQINGLAAREGQVVLPGDTLSTGPQSEVIVVMGANAFLVRDNTRLAWLADIATGVLRVLSGRVLAVFGPGAQRIETPTATIGIRGTGCYIESDSEQIYFCLCYGSADIVPLADPAQAVSLTTRYHDKPFTISRQMGAPLMQAAAVINHTDLELTLLEAAVGRRPPFAGQPSRY
jgi:hypothetical protein